MDYLEVKKGNKRSDMYSIIIIDDGNVSIYSIGNNPAVFSSRYEANKEIKSIVNMEKKLFGNQTLRFLIVNYSEEGIDWWLENHYLNL